MGGNEQIPPDDINTALKYDLRLHPYFESTDEHSKPVGDLSPMLRDPSQYLDGTRIYVQGSMWDGFADGMGNFTDGPYQIQYPEDFFKDYFYKYGFNPEVGSVGMPVASTIRATMPSEGWKIPVFKKLSNGYVKEVPNPIWEYHKYIPYSNPDNSDKVHDQIQLYGDAKDLDDFCLKVSETFILVMMAIVHLPIFAVLFLKLSYLLSYNLLRLNLLTTYNIELFWRDGLRVCGLNIQVY